MPAPATAAAADPAPDPTTGMPPAGDPGVNRKGTISSVAVDDKAGVWLAGQNVQVVCDGGLVQLHHRGASIATHARRHDPAEQEAGHGPSSKWP